MPEPPSPRGEGMGTVRIQQHDKLKFENDNKKRVCGKMLPFATGPL
jgi:hypothetical protein